ncbi:MAG: hypothetical protein JXQ73_03975 [Phycisphaerae bacterium]|nr:hypothetical protein [Phycisphaerae bacterium]
MFERIAKSGCGIRAMICSSCPWTLRSNSSSFRPSLSCVDTASRSFTNVRTTKTLTSTARSEFRTFAAALCHHEGSRYINHAMGNQAPLGTIHLTMDAGHTEEMLEAHCPQAFRR